MKGKKKQKEPGRTKKRRKRPGKKKKGKKIRKEIQEAIRTEVQEEIREKTRVPKISRMKIRAQGWRRWKKGTKRISNRTKKSR